MVKSIQISVHLPVIKKVIRLSFPPFLMWYLLLCVFYIIFLMIDHNFIFTEDIYVQSLGVHQLNEDKLGILTLNFRNNFLSSIALVPLALLAQILLVSFCLLIGFVLKEIKIPFMTLLVVITKSLIIFPFMDILTSIILISTQGIQTIKDTQKPTWFSLMFFFNEYQIPKWLIYPLKTMNIAECVFAFLLVYNLHTIYKDNISGKTVYKTAVWSYLLGLVFWVTFIIFLQISVS